MNVDVVIGAADGSIEGEKLSNTQVEGNEQLKHSEPDGSGHWASNLLRMQLSLFQLLNEAKLVTIRATYTTWTYWKICIGKRLAEHEHMQGGIRHKRGLCTFDYVYKILS